MFILKKGHQPGVYVPLRALFLVFNVPQWPKLKNFLWFLVSFYAINVTFLEIFIGIIERMQE